MTNHKKQVNNLNSLTNTFCANSADETCRVGAIWSLTLYVHDDSGHTRITNIRLIANDTLADDFYPISAATIVHDPLTGDTASFDEYNLNNKEAKKRKISWIKNYLTIKEKDLKKFL